MISSEMTDQFVCFLHRTHTEAEFVNNESVEKPRLCLIKCLLCELVGVYDLVVNDQYSDQSQRWDSSSALAAKCRDEGGH